MIRFSESDLLIQNVGLYIGPRYKQKSEKEIVFKDRYDK